MTVNYRIGYDELYIICIFYNSLPIILLSFEHVTFSSLLLRLTSGNNMTACTDVFVCNDLIINHSLLFFVSISVSYHFIYIYIFYLLLLLI